MDTTRTVPLGQLRLDRPEGGLPDGALVAARGARPVRTDGLAEYEVVGTESALFPALDGLAWGAMHVREQPATRTSTGGAAALARLVVVRTSDAGVPLDPPHLQVYDWADREEVAPVPIVDVALPAGIEAGGRLHGSLLPMGPVCIVVLSSSTTPGAVPQPLETYVVHDDVALSLGGIESTFAYGSSAVLTQDHDLAFRPGYVAMRVAYRTAWGTLPAGPPSIYQVPIPTPGGTPDPDAPHTIGFTVTLPTLSSSLQRIVTGFSVYVSTSQYTVDAAGGGVLPSARAAFGGPYRLVYTGEQKSGLQIVTDVKQPEGGLDTAPSLDDGDLAYARLRAVCGLTFNRRAVLGGAALDYPLPMFRPESGTGARARIAIEIETLNGTIERFGPAWDVDAGTVLVDPYDFVAGYEDRRAKNLVVYHERAAGGGGFEWARGTAFPLYAPPTANVAVLLEDDTVGTVGSPVPGAGGIARTDAEIDALNAVLDHDPNRLLAGEVGSVLSWPAARSLHVGDGPDDAVTALATTAQPVSAGQFGQYPMLALTRRRPQLIQTGNEDVFFIGARPAGSSRGCTAPEAAASVAGIVAAASLFDLRAYSPSADSDALSRPVGDEFGRYRDLFAGGVALGVLERSGGAELWATSTDPDVAGIICLTPSSDWYERDGDRVGWVQLAGVDGIPGGGLAGIDSEGRLWTEETAQAEVTVTIETAPLALEYPGEPKRLRAARVHQRPPLGSLVLAVTERIEHTGPSGIEDEEPVLSDVFASAIDGALVRFYVGSVIRPRFILAGSGRRGQRLSHITVQFEPRPRRALGPGVRIG